MKYCSNCGKELVDEAVICVHCGCSVAKKQNKQEDQPIKGKGLGVVLALFLGLIGLLLAIFLGDEECKKTAIKTFIICLIVNIGLAILFGTILFSSLAVTVV